MKPMRAGALSLLLASVALAQATVVSKEGTGEAAIVSNDQQKAFEEAKKNALRAAVEAAAGVRIDADTVVVNNQLVRDQVFANTSGYVKKFDVTAKNVDEKKKIVSVTVKADVITDQLDKDITAARDLVKRAGRPSIIIMLNEQTIQNNSKDKAPVITTSDNIATVLTERFKADGWDIKDAAFANGKVKISAGATLGSADAKEIGDISKAMFILYGSASIRNQEPDGMLGTGSGGDAKQSFFPVTGEYDLSLFATDVGTQVGKMTGKLGLNNAKDAGKVQMLLSYERTTHDLVKARSDEITSPMRAAVLEYFRNRQVNGAEISVAVTGLENFGAAQAFKKSLETLKGIKEIDQKDFAKGKAMYRVTYMGTPAELAEALEPTTFKKRKLEVTGVTGNTLEVALGK